MAEERQAEPDSPGSRHTELDHAEYDQFESADQFDNADRHLRHWKDVRWGDQKNRADQNDPDQSSFSQIGTSGP